MGELATMDRSGDTKLQWSATAPAEVETARQTFDTLRRKGYAAYRMRGDGSQGELIREFDVNAEKIILAPAMQGG